MHITMGVFSILGVGWIYCVISLGREFTAKAAEVEEVHVMSKMGKEDVKTCSG